MERARLGIDTSIDEFFDEHLEKVLGASPATAEAGSWYPARSNVVVRVTDKVPDLPRMRGSTVLAANTGGRATQ